MPSPRHSVEMLSSLNVAKARDQNCCRYAQEQKHAFSP